jgi:RNA polymerase sigma-70 factor (ECF subfamily)
LTATRSIRLWLQADPVTDRSESDDRSTRAASAAGRIETTVSSTFEKLEAHLGTVYRYALRLTGRPDAAEDLTQETLLRAWQHRHALRDERAARLWLLRVTQNLWTDQLRRQKRRPQVLEHEPPCPRIPVAVEQDQLEAVRLALAAMDELPPRQRQVLYLVTCEELTNAEVAGVLDMPLGAVKSNLSLARKEMRRRMKTVYDAARAKRAIGQTKP